MIREYIIIIVFAVFASILLASIIVSGKPTLSITTIIKKSPIPSLFDKLEIYPTSPDGGGKRMVCQYEFSLK